MWILVPYYESVSQNLSKFLTQDILFSNVLLSFNTMDNTINTAIISLQPSISLKQNFTKNSFILLGIIRKSGDRGMNKENSKSR